MINNDDAEELGPVTTPVVRDLFITVRGVKYKVRTNLQPQRFTDTRFFRNEDHLVAWLRNEGTVINDA